MKPRVLATFADLTCDQRLILLAPRHRRPEPARPLGGNRPAGFRP